jgi:RecQ family ATP-dependent DNA helicase
MNRKDQISPQGYSGPFFLEKDMKDTRNSKHLKEPPFNNDAPPHTDDDFYMPDPYGQNIPSFGGRPDVEKSMVNRQNNTGISYQHKKMFISTDLNAILQSRFQYDTFRPYQQTVCESVVKGNDVLLVMPTGSGKSLCYQLPGIARGGTTLVISPLIALMEDQTASLQAIGLRAERIHSGRSRIQSRQVCADYLKGKLDFLFIAPERLAIPGFPEMLAKRKATLIAIDEAHCISQWGHDFRPDYRLIGERLPILMPAPIIAMTATATSRVQEDILTQLGIQRAERHIHGFRRTNISIELMELLPSDRPRKVSEILKDEKTRPAIIYAPTRQKAEDLAEELKCQLSAEVYHAGLPAEVRDKVQTAFMSGQIEVIVATIAFGMGIDKKDIRTVIHTAMPGSLEGYYQEIGRAGRDGKPSRAILLHSYGDRRIHEFFHEKSYPSEEILKKIFSFLSIDKIPSDKLRESLKMDQEEFDTALEKLWIHGGVQVTPDDAISRGSDKWHASYNRQSTHRLNQIDEISRFTNSGSCRMLCLVRHFGDREDSGANCGICDFCSPQAGSSGARQPSPTETRLISEIIAILKESGGTGTGKLYNSICTSASINRTDFEGILRSLAKAGLLKLTDQSFEKDNNTITYRKAELTHKGSGYNTKDIHDIPVSLSECASRKVKEKAHVLRKNETAAIRHSTVSKGENPEIHAQLRKWRAAEARRYGVPAFRVFSNKVLDNLSSELPVTHDELLRVEGVGPRFDEKYGNEVIMMVKEFLRRQ